MLRSADLVAFVASADGARARRFYEEMLGLRLVEETPYALVFDCERHDAARDLRRERSVRRPTRCWAGRWRTSKRPCAGLAARGVAFKRYPALEQDEAGVWRSPSGARVAWFEDPDGNVLSLSQR